MDRFLFPAHSLIEGSGVPTRQVVFCGLLVKMGISCGIPAMRQPHRQTGVATYQGVAVQQGARIMLAASPGQVRCRPARRAGIWEALARLLNPPPPPPRPRPPFTPASRRRHVTKTRPRKVLARPHIDTDASAFTGTPRMRTCHAT